MQILQWIATNLLTQVAILIGLITAVGLILQRRAFEEVIGGALRAGSWSNCSGPLRRTGRPSRRRP
ncbi:MAG: hypothetical protein C4312_03590, partial [Thermoflexus sp.]